MKTTITSSKHFIVWDYKMFIKTLLVFLMTPKKALQILFVLGALFFCSISLCQSAQNFSDEPTFINHYLQKQLTVNDLGYTNDVNDENFVKINMGSSNSSITSTMPPTKLSLEQVRNGSGDSPNDPVLWQNGNAGASNAHYVEGWGIPYRAIITNIPGGSHSMDIAWDIKHSGANAIDFIGYYDLIDYIPGTHAANFNHPQETIDPTSGYGGMGAESTMTIPKPNFLGVANTAGTTFDAINSDGLAEMAIWNGTISSMNYIAQGDLTVASSTTILRIHFSTGGGTVILAWSGHIAKKEDWDPGLSASDISGSPYHSRIEQWDPGDDGIDFVNIGNQDRSLSAAAVINPPPCEITGPTLVCPSSTGHVYQNNAVEDPTQIPDGYNYEWSVTGNGSISGSNSGPTVTVDAGASCGVDYTVTLTIETDTGTFVTSCSKTVSVNDTTDPVLVGLPSSSVTVDCNSIPSVPSVTATDDCSTVTPIYTEVSNTVSDGCGAIVRKWDVSDDCGNSATFTQTITVTDTTDPVLVGLPSSTATVDCNSIPSVPSVTATDNCDSVVTPVYTEVSNTVSDGCGTIVRKWDVSDDCGNSATFTQTITVTDTTDPILVGLPSSTATVDCNSIPSVPSVTATDNCDSVVTPVYTEVSNTVSDGCGTIVRKWDVSDNCGNSATFTQTITVTDTTDPVITCPADMTLECDDSILPANTGSATATDNCDSSVTPTYSDSQVDKGCQSVITRTWTATDACGNSSNCVQYIIVHDTEAPVITCTTEGNATFSDNCSSESNITRYYRDNGSTRDWTAIDESGNIATMSCDLSSSPAKVSTSKEKLSPRQALIKAFPNPFRDSVKFVVDIPEDTEGSLRLVNLRGQLIKTVYEGQFTKGTHSLEAMGFSNNPYFLIYVLEYGNEKLTGKLIQK